MMSGGHYNYFYFKMKEFAEEVEADSKDKSLNISPSMRDEMRKLSKEIVTAAIKAYKLEWFLSGDSLEQEAYNALTDY